MNQEAIADEYIQTQKFQTNLHHYYKNLFPHQLFVDWLSYDVDNPDKLAGLSYFDRRELSFEADINGTMIYARYQHFANAASFQKKLMCEGGESCYRKIDIGAVFDQTPEKTKPIVALEKEFVIDIDMTDYDDVRTCCSGAKICKRCWQFLKVACEVLYRALTEDFGFESILWIFSGRRGIHLWVCDEAARKMQNPVRKSIISYLQLNISNENSDQSVKRMDSMPYHPGIQSALKVVKREFSKIIVDDQQSLREPKIFAKIINILGKDRKNDQLVESLKKTTTSGQVWRLLQEQAGEIVLNQIQMMCLYPRLDENVSKTINHLLKAPFSIHPSTQNVCVPFTYEEFRDFDYEQVPKLGTIIQQLSQLPEESKKQVNGLYPCLAEFTSMKQYVDIFDKFINNYKKLANKKYNRIQNIMDTEQY